MKICLYPHGGSGNHGCEAIVRSSSILLGRRLDLYSSEPQQDEYYGLGECCTIHRDNAPLHRGAIRYLKALWSRWICHDIDAFDKSYFSPIISSVSQGDICLSIGGDNYCYGTPGFIYLINGEVRQRKAKTILWGCSIETADIDERMKEDLSSYHLIYARESITFAALRKIGMKHVFCLPDPAFILPCQEVSLPQILIQNGIVGVNISPMVIGQESTQGITIQNYELLIEYILKKTPYTIALIPHVIWKHNDDREPLELLYSRFKSSHRIMMIEDNNASYLKGVIGKCKYMIAARTHASIAAYSQQVPTLVVGYSVKAQGIATDIFGNTQHYVIPVQELNHPETLTNEFCWLMQNEAAIRAHYSTFMPSYIQRLNNLSKLIQQL